MTLDLAISIHVGKLIVVHQQIIHTTNGQHILNGFDGNIAVDLLMKAGPVRQIRCRVEGAGKMRTSTNGIICPKILVKNIMPGELDVVQFDAEVLVWQIDRPGDIAVGKRFNGDIRDGSEI